MPGKIDRPPNIVNYLRDMKARTAELEQRQLAISRPGKTYTDVDRLNVGSFVQGAEFDIVIPPNMFLGVYLRSQVTNPLTNPDGEVTITINGVIWESPLILADDGGGPRWWFSSPGTTGTNSPGGIVIVDDESSPSPMLSISSEAQEVTLGFGYQRAGAGSGIDFQNNRMSIFYL